MTGRCLHCQGDDHRLAECIKTVFRRGTCCYSCGLPSRAYGEEIHRNIRTGECEAGLRDVIKGSIWCLYRSERWLRTWFRKEGLEWMGYEEFKEWSAVREGDGEVINGVRLAIAAWRDKHRVK